MSMLTRYPRLVGVLVIALAVAGAAFAILRHGAVRYAAGVVDGRNAVLAEDAQRAAQAQQVRDQRAAASAKATDHLQQQLGTQLPAIEGQAHAASETIRTIYRDRPVSDDQCRRPDGVQREIDAAIARANAAAGG